MRMLVTPEEYLKGSPWPSDPVLLKNMTELLYVINCLRTQLGYPLTVTSGIRTPEHNKKIGGSLGSSHLSCQGIDFSDRDGRLKNAMIANNNEFLIKYNLYMEHPSATPFHCHLQIRPTRSGNRVFMP